jgi:hypothetical protein
MNQVTPDPNHVDEFVGWLREPPRYWKVSDASKIEATNRTLESFVKEYGTPPGRGHIPGHARDAIWWSGLAVRDFGDYRLVYLGD